MSLKVKKTKTKKVAKRYDEAVKVQLLNAYHELRTGGKNAAVAAKEVGVPYITLRTWQKAREVKPTASKKPGKVFARGVRPSRKLKEPKKAPKSADAASTVVVVLPDGTRVEGLSAKEAVDFIKANR